MTAPTAPEQVLEVLVPCEIPVEARESLLHRGATLRIDGGCDHCDAWQDITYDRRLKLWELTVCHDADCGWYGAAR